MSNFDRNDGNWFPLPNSFVDIAMKYLTGAEMKVLLVICRKTIGWQKDEDHISITQIMADTGLGNKWIITCINKLEAMKIIQAKRTEYRTTKYSINLNPEEWCIKYTSVESTHVYKVHGGSVESTQGSVESTSEPVYKVHTQKTKDTINKDILQKKATPENLSEEDSYDIDDDWNTPDDLSSDENETILSGDPKLPIQTAAAESNNLLPKKESECVASEIEGIETKIINGEHFHYDNRRPNSDWYGLRIDCRAVSYVPDTAEISKKFSARK